LFGQKLFAIYGDPSQPYFWTRAEADAALQKIQPTTSNYVVFDDKIIDILKKYGITAGAALPPAYALRDGQQE
jgi:hypothetical protein